MTLRQSEFQEEQNARHVNRPQRMFDRKLLFLLAVLLFMNKPVITQRIASASNIPM
jgi:hypothetical protein